MLLARSLFLFRLLARTQSSPIYAERSPLSGLLVNRFLIKSNRLRKKIDAKIVIIAKATRLIINFICREWASAALRLPQNYSHLVWCVCVCVEWKYNLECYMLMSCDTNSVLHHNSWLLCLGVSVRFFCFLI